ncbi:hypothetical protein QCD60_26815 [Pokkaliibacter sp. MBI-7]|uniref:hypothetical protein n=1 Tax=Pokkaliibacter sp. MBI-7 TaxID=3040600 RepID=UPI00244AF3D8|nr:hypothetical protein [Pokkaliibacter sp. MBI-7]MDH2436148.1 hypothetical protein [Pokkaliibacter sp. MBI-7]
MHRRLLLQHFAGLGSALCCPALVHASTTTRPVLSFVFSRKREDPRTQWLIAVYTEALDALGYDFLFVEVPANRATEMSRSGEVDGELGRVYRFANLYPELIRVETANNPVRFAAFTLNSDDRIRQWSDLGSLSGVVDCRQGIKEIEQALNLHLPGHIGYVKTIEQGLLKLQEGRSRLFLDVEEAVYDYMSTDQGYSTLKGGAFIHEAGVPEATTGHCYLNRARHEALAAPLADVLQQMKEAGRHQQLLAKALTAAGYHDKPVFGERPPV